MTCTPSAMNGEYILNPYPPDEISHKAWQEGFEEGWKKAKTIIAKIDLEAVDIGEFESAILEAFEERSE